MPALNLTFTDEEMAALRVAAASADLSLKAFAHTAIIDATNDRKQRVLEAAKIIAQRSTELNRRLA
ncbi:antitoxin Phd [Antrihabitans sp. NCIMB 15449]|jgi:hypothetical protein|uniref:Antitoxin Phd n=1 Tax=Antrihabitans spumae TaxID=3373370 RepID=A0ABW7JJT6_9NOCA